MVAGGQQIGGRILSRSVYRWWAYALNVADDSKRLMESAGPMLCDRMEREALQMAINLTGQLPDGKERLAFLGFRYWVGPKRTIQRAAELAGVQKTVAEQWHKEFILLIGSGLGFSAEVSKKPRKKRKKKLPDSKLEGGT